MLDDHFLWNTAFSNNSGQIWFVLLPGRTLAFCVGISYAKGNLDVVIENDGAFSRRMCNDHRKIVSTHLAGVYLDQSMHLIDIVAWIELGRPYRFKCLHSHCCFVFCTWNIRENNHRLNIVDIDLLYSACVCISVFPFGNQLKLFGNRR